MKFFINLIFVVVSLAKAEKVTPDLSYGSDPQQKLDLYEPSTPFVDKAAIVIHGGGWIREDKEEMNTNWVNPMRKNFKDYIVANMNYRLAKVGLFSNSPGFPKQIDDIRLVIEFLKKRTNNSRLKVVLLGASAGAHLAMLYGYAYNKDSNVKLIVNYVGPADFTAWSYASCAACFTVINQFVGNYNFWTNPGIYYERSPVAWIKPGSPKTISFYGNFDLLIPNDQNESLTKRLNQAGVTNEIHIYNGGHIMWSDSDIQDSIQKYIQFIKKHQYDLF